MLLIDVRTKEEFDEGHLKTALHIPHTEIQDVIEDYITDHNAEIVVYCRSGHRSGFAKEILEELGYQNVVNAGGYEALIDGEYDS